MQEHKMGSPVWWGLPFRVILFSNGFMIAEAKTREEIEEDWNFIMDEAKERLLPNLDTTHFDSMQSFVSFFTKLHQHLEDRKSTHHRRNNSWTSATTDASSPSISQSSSPNLELASSNSPTIANSHNESTLSSDEEANVLASAIFNYRLSVDFERKIKEMNIPIEKEMSSEVGKQESSPRNSLEEVQKPRVKLDHTQLKILMKIPQEEEIIYEFPCLFLAGDICQGTLYLTTNYVVFLDSSSVDNQKLRSAPTLIKWEI